MLHLLGPGPSFVLSFLFISVPISLHMIGLFKSIISSWFNFGDHMNVQINSCEKLSLFQKPFYWAIEELFPNLFSVKIFISL